MQKICNVLQPQMSLGCASAYNTMEADVRIVLQQNISGTHKILNHIA